MDEIPTALREKNRSSLKNQSLFISGKGAGIKTMIWFVIGIITVIILSFSLGKLTDRNPAPVALENTNPAPVTVEQNIVQEEEKPVNEEIIPENILGHLAYEQAPLTELKAITADGRIRLRVKSAEKYSEMATDARRQGISLVPISGFRAIDEQEYLFFEIKQQRNQGVSERAEVSAPPGYSEHHTGYAIDIGDGNNPNTNLSVSFENTPAFKWLQQNAPRYSFELSFPRDNLQGISYEPWHWRFVGDTHSLKTFYQARQITQPLQ